MAEQVDVIELCPLCGEPYHDGVKWHLQLDDGEWCDACQMCWEADCDRLWWKIMQLEPIKETSNESQV